MGLDIRGLVERMIQDAAFATVINNPLAQFGPPARQYLGATLLPEKPVPENEYVEEAIQFRTLLANHGTRYSPVQIKQGVLSGQMRVSLSNSDIGSQITGADYDALIRLIERTSGTQGVPGGNIDRPTMMAMQEMGNWSDLTLNRPLLETNEKMRWDSIVDASTILVGNNGYRETVTYPNPAGHRVAAGGAWSSSAYDPYADIMAGAEFLAGLGYTVNRIITSTSVRSKLALNTKITSRMGRINVQANVLTNQPVGRATQAELSMIFGSDGLPPLELYDLQYRTSTSSGYFLKRDVFVMIATTGRDRAIDLGDLQPMPEPMMINNTIGYLAVGRPAGQSGPGRVAAVRAIDNSKPPRIEGEGWQTSLPVITDPEAIFVITTIT